MHFAGSPIAFMAAVHCAASFASFMALEHHGLDMPFWTSLVTGLPDDYMAGGYSAVPDKPGLGVDLNLEAVEANDEPTRRAKFQDHARRIRDHLSSLSKKSYWEQFDQAPEFAVLFLPGECFFSAALESDAQLMEYGVEQNVILATPTTLIALLRAVALGWREEALARNAEEVAELGKQLYERIGKLASHWTDVGSKLEKTVAAYNASVGTLEGRVLVTARRFKELGVATEGGEIEAPEPVDTVPRALQAPELVTSGPTASVERIARIG